MHQRAHVARQNPRALRHFGKCLGLAHQCLRHRLGKPLRLRQGLARRFDLLRGTVRTLQRPTRNQYQQHHTARQ